MAESITKVLEEKIEALEKKILHLEKHVAELITDRDRFLQAMRGAAEMALNNNVTAMMMPKDMRRTLQEYVTNGKKT